MEPELCYRVGDKIFNTVAEAKNYSSMGIRDEINQNIRNIQALKAQKQVLVEKIYKNKAKTFDKCNCEHNKDYSQQCLRHFCTCEEIGDKFPEKAYDRFICDYHTNIYYRNQGCPGCRHKDCSKWYCRR